MIPIIPVAALVTAVVFWFSFLYVQRSVMRSAEVKALGLLVCIDATGVLLVLALCSSQSYVLALLERWTF